MSSFVTAMDNHSNRTTIPSKPGTMVRKTLGFDTKSKVLELWTMLKRGTEKAEIEERIINICNTSKQNADSAERRELLSLLVRAIVQKRDCRKGGGEKTVVYHSLLALYSELPKTVAALLAILPKFGYWKDLCFIAEECKTEDKKDLLSLIAKTMADGIRSKDVLCCKWAPREKKSGAWLAALVRKELKFSKKCYRQYLSKVMNENAVSIPEVLMSKKRFRDIEPAKVPSRCLKVHRLAFIDEDKKGARRHVYDEDPQLADREICRKKFEEHLNEGKSVKGARNFPHEIVKEVGHGVSSDLQRKTLNALWQAIVDDVKKQIMEQKEKAGLKVDGEKKEEVSSEETSFDPSKMVPMCDVSGSMTCANGIPMNNSVALGLLLSEIGHPAFRNRVLTFHSQPSWVVFDEGMDFVDRVNQLKAAPWGMSTNFEAAMGLIANVVRKNRLLEEEVPGIVCFSDMKFNSATGNGYGSTGNVFDTHYERIQALFANVGNEITGAPYKAPRLCFWDLAHNSGSSGGQPGFPVTANDQGVQLISGFSPALLKLVMTGERLDTPWETFMKAVGDDRYDEVEMVALQAMEIDSEYSSSNTEQKFE